MRRITLWLFSTVVAFVLLFSYRTSTNSAGPHAAVAAAAADPGGNGTGTGGSSSTSGSATTGAKTYTGATASTRWGDVQVSITVASNKITDVRVPLYPHDNGRDQEINSYALPTLRQETLSAQSANIQAVSGATVTSGGYLQSLQSALDAAHLS